ncbi:flagellar protein export ATPase FliI [Planctomycetota bacterium]|nr:flagellar protein export ATPase FliI [Planctomycetota bacterium]
MLTLDRYHHQLNALPVVQASGVVLRVVGLAVVASGPGLPVGDTVAIRDTQGGSRVAVVTGFREGEVILQPLGRLDGIRPGDQVIARHRGLDLPVGPGLIGRVIDGLGEPLDGLGPIPGLARRSLHGEPPPAMLRAPIDRILETGIKAVDSLFTLGCGQRLGIFAGSGVGKSTLLGEMAKHAKAEVNVIALVGERGREVGDFMAKALGPEGLRRSVVIAATSDRPAVERMSAALAAHAVAEHFRDAGLDVLLMLDSITRLCQAQREIGLAAGEPPVRSGYPPSAFAMLPRLLERAGMGVTGSGGKPGSITALYTVLVEGDDENDPVADTVRAILDGHLFLSRKLAGQAIYPAIDPTLSVSRLLQDLATPEEQALVQKARGLWSEYERVRDLVEVGAYRAGTDPRIDQAIAAHPRLSAFVRQDIGFAASRAETMKQLKTAVGA